MMENQYGMADLRQYISGRPLFTPPVPASPGFLATHIGFSPSHALEMFVVPKGLHQEFCSDSTNSAGVDTAHKTVDATTVGGFSLFESESAGGQSGGGDTGTVRWPKQETLTLLEIRSKLDSKFKEANQKGPLWDEVSRIMYEEHGYLRSGKKCREKFENLYKYYKKTKEGKAGRQDGKHYRFYRQLEALDGETTNLSSTSKTHFNGGSFQYSCQNKNTFLGDNQVSYPGLKHSDTTFCLSNSSDPDTSLSDDTDTHLGIDDDKLDKRKMKKRKGKRNWKAKIRDFIDSQMKKLMDKQESLMEKMMRNIEHKEKERMTREEEWRKQDAARIEREYQFWASERAWMEARDNTLMDALQKLTAKELRAASLREEVMAPEIRSLSGNQNDDGSVTMTNSSKGDFWPETEIRRVIQLRTGIEAKFQQSGISEEVLWDEVSHKMACFGHERSGLMCKEKWDSVNNYELQCNKKRKEDSKGCSYNYLNNVSMCNQRGEKCSDTSEQGINYHAPRINNPNNVSPYSNGNEGDTVSDGCFRFFMGDGLGRIMD
ncbi:trihelix transcription factor PTL-like isoform X1 [Primulina tabacum]|uniref:trihelix transcription factor PTL-like isoform X1 n=1 Tax=Primulina tabacum TaxID=48773 RepID=UPI003F5A1B35